MITPLFTAWRRQLTLSGGHATHGAADAITGRNDDAEFRPAILIDPPLRAIPVGEPLAWDEDVAFLDGTQHVELLGYVGVEPILGAVVRSAVRLRHERKLSGAAELVRHLIIGRSSALAAIDRVDDHCELVSIDDEAPHPIRDVQQARSVVDRARAGLEVAVARIFREGNREAWFIVDGSIAATPEWSDDTRLIGIVKSHAMLPFEGADLHEYLHLPRNHRSPVFMPQSRRVTPLYSWALRLHEFGGRDLFHGLIRVEAPATDRTVEMATLISQHLLAERAPRANDPRADRLLYGIHDVERYLGARGA